ncbi:uncharacterized protein C10orf95-like [Pezoporus occidentalis]|uniref:uncharacterized protein C10orf95-like n=1 Tax=Pezoporus occidentalis TaxID=407982 RepID=UPI002F9086F4
MGSMLPDVPFSKSESCGCSKRGWQRPSYRGGRCQLALPAADQGRLAGFPSAFPPTVLGRSVSTCSTAAECLGKRPAARGFPAVLHASPRYRPARLSSASGACLRRCKGTRGEKPRRAALRCAVPARPARPTRPRFRPAPSTARPSPLRRGWRAPSPWGRGRRGGCRGTCELRVWGGAAVPYTRWIGGLRSGVDGRKRPSGEVEVFGVVRVLQEPPAMVPTEPLPSCLCPAAAAALSTPLP